MRKNPKLFTYFMILSYYTEDFSDIIAHCSNKNYWLNSYFLSPHLSPPSPPHLLSAPSPSRLSPKCKIVCIWKSYFSDLNKVWLSTWCPCCGFIGRSVDWFFKAPYTPWCSSPALESCDIPGSCPYLQAMLLNGLYCFPQLMYARFFLHI